MSDELDRARHDVAEAERVVLAIATQCADELVALAEQADAPTDSHREHAATVERQLVAAVASLRRHRRKLAIAGGTLP
jgi:hypothetical protein